MKHIHVMHRMHPCTSVGQAVIRLWIDGVEVLDLDKVLASNDLIKLTTLNVAADGPHYIETVFPIEPGNFTEEWIDGDLEGLSGPKISEGRDGWTGHPCPECSGTDEFDICRPCGACGGTGEEYISALDERDLG